MIYVVALLVACTAVRLTVGPFRAPGLAQKLDAVERSKGKVNLAFVGSSRVFRHFDPRVFDQELGQHGVSFRSYSISTDAMRPPETLYVARQVLRMPSPPKWLFFELWDVFPLMHMENGPTIRAVSWHDMRHTAMALRHLAVAGLSWADTRDQFEQHLSSFAVNFINLGRAVDWTEPRQKKAGQPVRRSKPVEEDPARGFQPVDEPRFTAAEEQTFLNSVEKLRHQRRVSALSPELRNGLRILVEEARRAGVNLVFVINPTAVDGEEIADLPKQGLDVPLISFADPNRFPELYDPVNHRDSYHLNSRGAAIYSRVLAEQFLPLLHSAPGGETKVLSARPLPVLVKEAGIHDLPRPL